MSSRTIRLAGGLLLTGLAFGLAPTAPAFADGMFVPPVRHHVQHVRHHLWHAPRVIERVRVVTRTVPVEHVRVVNRYVPVDRPVPVYVQQPVYQSACGGCGSHAYVASAPVQYNYGTSCGGCGYGRGFGYGVAQTSTYYNAGGYVGGSEYTGDEEYGPTYTSGYYTGGYIGSGYLRGGLRFAGRTIANEAGFRRGFYGRRTFAGRRGFYR